MDENTIRANWKTGCACQIYSNSKKKWFPGEVAQIFTDEEGEWLEVRYDKSMSKQVQRYSSDIKPSAEDLKKKKKTTKKDIPFQETEMKLRQSWDKGDEVEIFSNTHQEWYLGEVVDIIKDDEGEWLNCVWARANGEAMSKQVQRFSTDVRPVADDGSTSGSSSDDDQLSPKNNKLNKTPSSPADKIRDIAKKIADRRTNFRRRAPPFSRTLRPSTFTYPATSSARRSRKLLDLEESIEKNQHVVDHMPTRKKNKLNKLNIGSFKSAQVREFIRSLGSAYERYLIKFRNVKGSQLVKFNENHLQKIGVSHKLHRCRILLEVAKNININNDIFDSDIDVLNWNSQKVKEWVQKNPSKVISIYAQKFYNNGVIGVLLFDLDHKDLKTIEVKKIHQKGVLEQIAKFRDKVFPPNDNDDQKDQEPNHTLNLNDGDKSDNKKRTRGSVAHIDVSQLQLNGGTNIIDGLNGIGIGSDLRVGNNNDAIIYTMGHLLLELGAMFSVGKIQQLTTSLKNQLKELQENSIHPKMMKLNPNSNKNQKNNLKVDVSNNNKLVNTNKDLVSKMQDKVDNSPTGLNSAAAWLKTNMGAKGHKRRSSLPYLNTNQLNIDDDDIDDDDDDVSDLDQLD